MREIEETEGEREREDGKCKFCLSVMAAPLLALSQFREYAILRIPLCIELTSSKFQKNVCDS